MKFFKGSESGSAFTKPFGTNDKWNKVPPSSGQESNPKGDFTTMEARELPMKMK